MEEIWNGPLCRLSQCRFDHGDELLCGIEVGAVGRQVLQERSCLLDQIANLLALVSGEVVHHDDVSRSQVGYEHLANVLGENVAVHGAVDGEGRSDAIGTQSQDGSDCFPVPEWHPTHQSRAALGTTAQPRHLGGSASLIEEDELVRIAGRLPRDPILARLGDVRPLLLCGVNGFF